jgi:hypothetical protein
MISARTIILLDLSSSLVSLLSRLEKFGELELGFL